MRKPARFRYQAQKHYALLHTVAAARRQVERSQWHMLIGMALLLSITGCCQKFMRFHDTEHPTPVLAQKGGKQR
ncbi:hypothetical protein GCM10027346_20980 [Hymenobacter seoulensis]